MPDEYNLDHTGQELDEAIDKFNSGDYQYVGDINVTPGDVLEGVSFINRNGIQVGELNPEEYSSPSMWYGYCQTNGSTQEKVVQIDGIEELEEGLSIRVRFRYAQDYDGIPTLNLNQLGAVNIRRIASVNASKGDWSADETIDLCYEIYDDVGYWVIVDGARATTSLYGYTKLSNSITSSDDTVAATPKAVNNAYNTLKNESLLQTDKVITIGAYSDDDHVPSAKATYDAIQAATHSGGNSITWSDKVDVVSASSHATNKIPSASAVYDIVTDSINTTVPRSWVKTSFSSPTDNQVPSAKLTNDTIQSVASIANAAIPKSNITTVLNQNSDNDHVPSAKTVYDFADNFTNVYSTVSGNTITIENGKAGSYLRDLDVEFDAIQDLNGYDFAWPPGGYKNIIPSSYTDGDIKSNNGITFSASQDGIITLAGTATARASFCLTDDILLTSNKYGLRHTGYSSVKMQVYDKNSGSETLLPVIQTLSAATINGTTIQTAAATSAVYLFKCDSNKVYHISNNNRNLFGFVSSDHIQVGSQLIESPLDEENYYFYTSDVKYLVVNFRNSSYPIPYEISPIAESDENDVIFTVVSNIECAIVCSVDSGASFSDEDIYPQLEIGDSSDSSWTPSYDWYSYSNKCDLSIRSGCTITHSYDSDSDTYNIYKNDYSTYGGTGSVIFGSGKRKYKIFEFTKDSVEWNANNDLNPYGSVFSAWIPDTGDNDGDEKLPSPTTKNIWTNIYTKCNLFKKSSTLSRVGMQSCSFYWTAPNESYDNKQAIRFCYGKPNKGTSLVEWKQFLQDNGPIIVFAELLEEQDIDNFVSTISPPVLSNGINIFESQASMDITYPSDLIDYIDNKVNVITPESFGAVGDGIFDDTLSLQYAFNTGRSIIFDNSKTYKVTNSILLYPNTVIDLNNSTIVSTTANLFLNCSRSEPTTGYDGRGNITIKNGTIIGGEILLAHASNIELRNINFRNSLGGHCIQIMSCNRVRIEECSFKGLKGTSNPEYINLDLCLYSNFGIYEEDSSAYDDTNNDDILIQGCYFGLSTDEGYTNFREAFCSHSSGISGDNYDLHLFHNNVRMLNNIIDSVPAGGYGIYLSCCKNSIVQGNKVSSNNYSVYINYSENISINDNVFRYLGSQTDKSAIHIYTGGVSGLSVYNNSFIDYSNLSWISKATSAHYSFDRIDNILLASGSYSSGDTISLSYDITLFNRLVISFGDVSQSTYTTVEISAPKDETFSVGQTYPISLLGNDTSITIGNPGTTVVISNNSLNVALIKASKSSFYVDNDSTFINENKSTAIIYNLNEKIWDKRPIIEGYPFYEIIVPFTTSRVCYRKSGNTWNPREIKASTVPIPCPRYLMVYPKKFAGGSYGFIYIGDIIDGEFVIDQSIELNIKDTNYINFVGCNDSTYNRASWSFKTYESDGSKYMVILGSDDSKVSYTDDIMIIGADEWPKSPFKLNTWTIVSANTLDPRKWKFDSIEEQGYYLPEKSWIFIKDTDYSLITFGVGTSKTNAWSKYVLNASAFYIPEGAGTSILTIGQSDIVTENNICVIPKIIDKCISSNSIKAVNFADNVLSKFRYIGQVDPPPTPNPGETIRGVYVAEDYPIIKGKEYHTIPYSQGLYGQHYVCFDTTPETAANAANDEYSVFYDTTAAVEFDSINHYSYPRFEQEFIKTETINLPGGGVGYIDQYRPGYGGVCSTFVTLASGSPYTQTIDGLFVDDNFEITMANNVRSGDILISNSDASEHGAFVDYVFENGYSTYEEKPAGITQYVHTSKADSRLAEGNTMLRYLNNYNFSVASKDRSGWKNNYLNFDYEIVNGTVRPWRGNKSVGSNYNIDYTYYARSSPGSVEKHTGMHITVHDPDPSDPLTAYLKKVEDENAVEISTTNQTVIDIKDYLETTGSGEYELWSSKDPDKEYVERFRYFEYDKDITWSSRSYGKARLYIDENGKAIFSLNAIDYAYVWTYSVDVPYAEVNGTGKASISVIANGVKYKGVNNSTIRSIRCAMIKDMTRDENGIEDSWGRYKIRCRLVDTMWDVGDLQIKISIDEINNKLPDKLYFTITDQDGDMAARPVSFSDFSSATENGQTYYTYTIKNLPVSYQRQNGDVSYIYTVNENLADFKYSVTAGSITTKYNAIIDANESTITASTSSFSASSTNTVILANVYTTLEDTNT